MVSRLWLVLLRSLWAHWAPLRPMRAFSALGFSWPSELVAAFAAGRGLYAPGATISFSRCKKAETARPGKTRQGQARPDKPSPGPGPGQASPIQLRPAQAQARPGQGFPSRTFRFPFRPRVFPFPGEARFPKGSRLGTCCVPFVPVAFPPFVLHQKTGVKLRKSRHVPFGRP